MRWHYRVWLRLRTMFRRGRAESELGEEVRLHIERMTEENAARGMSAAEARRAALVEFGGVEQVKEGCRDARGVRWLEEAWQDLRYAVRTLARKPGFTAVVLAMLAVGIGGTTVMFTVVDGVLLRPLPYRDPARLVSVTGRQTTLRSDVEYVAYPDFLDFRRMSRSIAFSGWVYNSATLSKPGDAEYEQQFEITHDVFSVLGVKLFQGRGFHAEEDRPGGAPVAILGYGLWRRHFGGSAGAVGSRLVLDGKEYTIVGIAPPGLELDGEGDVYTPLGQDTDAYLKTRVAHPVRVLGRLRTGATLDGARAEITLIGRDLAKQYPDTDGERVFRVERLRVDVSDVRAALWLLLGAVGLVLLVACVNVASLMLVRAVSREREMAMRAALGAGRLRLLRHCLTESAVLSLGGGALGVALAAVWVKPFLRFWPGELPRANEVQLDGRVLGFAVAVSLASGLLFGLAPALRLPVRSIEQALRSGARSVAGSGRRVHAAFVISEIALAAVLLVSAGALGRTLLKLSRLDPGVKVGNVLTARVALSPSVLAHPGRIRAGWDDLLERARRLPGVESAAAVDTVPLREGYNENGYWPSASVPPVDRQPVAISTCVTPEYLKVMGLALRAGRWFNDGDRLNSAPVIVIDDVLARSAFPGQNAVGRRLWIPDFGDVPREVVGVAGHVRYWGLAGDDQAGIRAQFYYPFAQIPDAWTRRWSTLMSIVVRTKVPPLSVVEPLRHELRGEANDQVLYEVRTLEQLAEASLGQQRFLLLLFGIFAALSLLLSCAGIYGVLEYLTRLRVPEFGVRMALGASARDVLGLVLGQSIGMIGLGAAAGGLGALAAGTVLRRMVTGMQAPGVLTFAMMIGLLICAALAASFVPAWRASRLDPASALREE